jgi:hypothetical protein
MHPRAHRIVYQGRIHRSCPESPNPTLGHGFIIVPVVKGGGGDGGVQVKQRKYLVKMKEDPKQVCASARVYASRELMPFRFSTKFLRLGTSGQRARAAPRRLNGLSAFASLDTFLTRCKCFNGSFILCFVSHPRSLKGSHHRASPFPRA